jgi:hypothetical protein
VLQPRHFEDVVALQDLLKRAAGRLRPIVTLPTQWVADFLDAAATRSGRLAFEMLATVLAAEMPPLRQDTCLPGTCRACFETLPEFSPEYRSS